MTFLQINRTHAGIEKVINKNKFHKLNKNIMYDYFSRITTVSITKHYINKTFNKSFNDCKFISQYDVFKKFIGSNVNDKLYLSKLNKMNNLHLNFFKFLIK